MNDFNFEAPNTLYDQHPEFSQDQKPNNSKGFALASLILGIAAIFCACICCVLYFLSIILAILSIVFACIAKKKNEGKMPGMARAGWILAIVAILFFLLVVCFEVYVSTLSDEEFAKIFESIFGIRLEDFIAEYEKSFGAPFTYKGA